MFLPKKKRGDCNLFFQIVLLKKRLIIKNLNFYFCVIVVVVILCFCYNFSEFFLWFFDMSFEIILNKPQLATLWRFEGADINAKAKVLQSLFDRNIKLYEREKQRMEKDGSKFQVSDKKVYQCFSLNKTREIPIKFQVKGSTMTWYLVAPKDTTLQEFRDQLYKTAAKAHLKVENHCRKYYTGSDSLHIKKMHTHKDEINCNHEHYRIQDDQDVQPVHVYQHLSGFIEAQKELGYSYLDQQEALAICHKFKEHWARVNYVGPSTSSYPARKESILSTYKRSPDQVLTHQEILDWEKSRQICQRSAVL